MKLRPSSSFNFLKSVLSKLLQGFVAHPRLALGVLTLALAAGFYWGSQVKIAIRMEDLNDPRLISHQRMQALKKDFGFEDKLTLVFARNTSLRPEDFCRLKEWIDALPLGNLGILEVSSVFDLRIPQYGDRHLFYPLLIQDPCLGNWSPEQLRSTPGFDYFNPENLRDTLVHFRMKEYDPPFRHGAFDYSQVEEIVERAKHDLPEFTVIPGGTLFFQASVLRGIHWGSGLNVAVAIVLFGAFTFLFRSLKASGVLLTMILITNTILKGGMGIFQHPIDPLSTCLFMMITVAIIEDFVFLCHIIKEEGATYLEAVDRLLVSSFLTSFTTAIGFGSLMLSPNPNVFHFGIWTSLGALFEWALMFLFFPALLTVFPAAANCFRFPTRAPSRILAVLSSFKFPRGVTIGMALLPFALGAVAYHKSPNLGFSPFHMFEKNHEINHFREHFITSRNAEGEVSIVFKKNDPKIPEVLEKFGRDPFVSHIYSREIIKPILRPLPAEIHTLILEDFGRSAFGKLFSSSHSERAILLVKSYETSEIAAFEKRAQQICGTDCELASEIIVSKDFAQGLLDNLYHSFSASLVIVSVLLVWLCFALRSRAYLPVLLSTAWAAIFLLSLVLLLKIRIDVVTSVALSVLIGLTGDNAIQFMVLGSHELKSSVMNYGRASLQALSLMMLMTGMVYFSYFHSPKVLASLLGTGLILMITGDLWIFSGLLELGSKRKKKQVHS